MKKTIYTIAAGLMTSLAANAQKNNIPAPAHATAVIEYNFPQIFSKISEQQFNQYSTGRQLYESLLIRDYNYDSDIEISNTGIDHSHKSFLHFVNTDSLNYMVKLLPIKDINQFKKLVDLKNDAKFETMANGKVYKLKYDESVFIPNNNEYAILLERSNTYNAFDDKERAKRWGIPEDYKYGYYDGDEVTETTAYSPDQLDSILVAKEDSIVDAYTAAATQAAVDAELKRIAAEEEKVSKDKNSTKKASKTVTIQNEDNNETTVVAVDEGYDDVGIVEAAPPEVIEDAEYDDDYLAREKKNKEISNKKDSIFNIWTKDFLNSFVGGNKDSYAQLSHLRDFKPSEGNNAVSCYLNIADLSNSIVGDLSYRFLAGGTLNASDNINDNWYKIDLNFNQDNVNINAVGHLDENYAKRSKAFYKRKYNKKYNKYINSKTDIGVWGMAMNTQNYLEGTPELIKDFMSNYHYMNAESALYADLFSLIVDEKAVGKVFWGDGVFVFTNVKDKTYEAITYDWDEESFESTKTHKLTTEKLPNFLMMFTTKDSKTIKRILDFGVQKGAYTFSDDVYAAKQLSSEYDPFEYFCTIKDGIVFLSTEKMEIENIRNGNKRGTISAYDKKLLRKNATSAWFNGNQLVGAFTNHEKRDDIYDVKINRILGSIGRMELKSKKIKGNTFSADYTLKVPNKGYANSLIYLLNMIEDLKQL